MNKVLKMLALIVILGTGIFIMAHDAIGVETGTISGRIFKPNLTGLAHADVWIDLGDDNKIYGESDDDGFYFFSGVPAGTGYDVCAKKLPNWCKKCQHDVDVTAGENTTVDIVVVACD